MVMADPADLGHGKKEDEEEEYGVGQTGGKQRHIQTWKQLLEKCKCVNNK